MNASQTEYFRRVLGPASGLDLNAGVVRESFSPESMELTGKAVSALKAGDELTPAHQYVLESIVARKGRPVFDICDDSFANPGPDWVVLEQSRSKIENAIRSIGRVDFTGMPAILYAGTAFIVGPGILMTNRHVAELFATGPGYKQLQFISGRTASVDLKQEVSSSESVPLQVTEVLLIHPYWDCALLRVSGLDGSRVPLTLASRPLENLAGLDAAVIGYPAFNPSPSENPALQMEIFGGTFQKKRLQPGKLMADGVHISSYGNDNECLTHDCSTLGGNSGSAVLALPSGLVAGLHFMGLYMTRNYAGACMATGSRSARGGFWG